MPILYESYARVPRPKKLRARRISSLQEVEADRYRVVEEYAVSSIYMTPDDLSNHIRAALEEACAKKNAVLESFRPLDMWAIWKIFYTEYHIKYEAYITGKSPIAGVTVILILAIALGIIIIFAIWLVKTYIIEPIWGPIPEELKPWLGTLLVIGAGLVAVGTGIYIVKSVMPKVRARRKK